MLFANFPLDLESLFEVFAGRQLNTTVACVDHTTGSSLDLIIPLVLVLDPLCLVNTGILLWILCKSGQGQSQGNMQKVNIVHATLPEGMDSSSSDVFVNPYEYLPEGMDISSSDVFVNLYDYLPEGMDSSSSDVFVDSYEYLPEGMDISSSDVFVDSYDYLPEGMDSSSSDVFVDSYEYLPEGMDISISDVFVDSYEYLPEGMDISSSDMFVNPYDYLPEGMDSSSSDVFVDSYEYLPEGMDISSSDVFVDSYEYLPEGMDISSSDVFVNPYDYLPEGMDSSSSDVFVDSYEYLPEGMDSSSAQPSTSAAVLSQEHPQTRGQEPTPATDALETEPMVDYAQPSTSAAVLSERNPSSSPTDGPVKINPTGSFDSFYELGKKLASKSHGIVHEGIRKSDDKQVIIKFVKKRRFDFHIGHSEPLCREAAIMRIMKHSDHVVKLYDWFDMEDDNILVMEHPGTSITLWDFIRENGGRLTEAVAKDIMQELIAAFRLCSERGVYYKDISLRKVLIDPDTMQIKITGFYRALTIIERQTAKLKSVAERRIQALMATNEGLYRVLKGMVEAKSLKLWFGWKNAPLSKECQDLLRKLRDRESEITLQNMLDHDWFKKTPGTDALESDVTLMFPHEPTLPCEYFRCLFEVGKKVGYDDRVHEGIRRSDGQKVDIKFVERCRLWETSPEFVKEGTTLLKLQKPPTCDHFIRLYERFFLKDQTVLEEAEMSTSLECVTEELREH
ncbi:uncharacterized protein LOC143726051 [Siphateles boraxobius]|uniref:uncharacterized protein LOC143726051 n=1 Tax=Siphateles boraxobius TaxID=180520 RepID=UPI004062E0CC